MTTKEREGLQRAEAKAWTFKLLQRQRLELYAIAESTGTSVAEQIRRGIDLWIAQQKRRNK